MKYPIGIQSFDRIIEDGYVYVDKTDLIYRLTCSGDWPWNSWKRSGTCIRYSILISTAETLPNRENWNRR